MVPQSGASFAENRSHSYLFTLKAKRQQGYKLLVIPKIYNWGLLFTRKVWLLHEREASPYPGRRYFQKYVDEAAKKEVMDIFEGRGRGDVPAPSGKRAPLGLDAEGVLFMQQSSRPPSARKIFTESVSSPSYSNFCIKQ